MHCAACGYALWNLTEPRCPECGTGFDWRRYSFVPGTVAFTCPDCGHAHAGQGENHHPSTEDVMICAGCQREIDLARMGVKLLVDNPNHAAVAPADAVPWERRGQIGIWAAWLQTVQMGALRPRELVTRLGHGDRRISAMLFATLTWIPVAACNTAISAMGLAPWPRAELALIIAAPVIAFVYSGVTMLCALALMQFVKAVLGRWAPTHQLTAASLYCQAPVLLAAVAFFRYGGPLLAAAAFVWIIFACVEFVSALPAKPSRD